MGRMVTPEEFLRTGQTWIVDPSPIEQTIEVGSTAELDDALDILLAPERKGGSGDRLSTEMNRVLQKLGIEIISKVVDGAGEKEARDRGVRLTSQAFNLGLVLNTNGGQSLYPKIDCEVERPPSGEYVKYDISNPYLWVKNGITLFSQPKFVADSLVTVLTVVHEAIAPN